MGCAGEGNCPVGQVGSCDVFWPQRQGHMGTLAASWPRSLCMNRWEGSRGHTRHSANTTADFRFCRYTGRKDWSPAEGSLGRTCSRQIPLSHSLAAAHVKPEDPKEHCTPNVKQCYTAGPAGGPLPAPRMEKPNATAWRFSRQLMSPAIALIKHAFQT